MKKLIRIFPKVVVSLLLISQLAPTAFLDTIIVKGAVPTITYSGPQSAPIEVKDGEAELIIFDNVTVNGTKDKPNAISLANGGAYKLEFRGTNEVHGFDAQYRGGTPNSTEMETEAFDRSGAGIKVQGKNTKVTISGADGVVLNITGGNAANGTNATDGGNATSLIEGYGRPGARGYGGSGGSAAIGAQGGTIVRDLALNSVDELQSQGGVCGEIEITGGMSITGHGGYGGKGGNGGRGGTGTSEYALVVATVHSGGGGGGGGGGGYPAPLIGGGGAAGGNGAKGTSGVDSTVSSVDWEIAVAGAGGGGGYGWGGGGAGNAGASTMYCILQSENVPKYQEQTIRRIATGGDGYNNSYMVSFDAEHKYGNPGAVTAGEAQGGIINDYYGMYDTFMFNIGFNGDNSFAKADYIYGGESQYNSQRQIQFYAGGRVNTRGAYGGTKNKAGINSRGERYLAKLDDNDFPTESTFVPIGNHMVRETAQDEAWENFDSYGVRNHENNPDSSIGGLNGETSKDLILSESTKITSDNKGFSGFYGNGEGTNYNINNRFVVSQQIDLSDPKLNIEMNPISKAFEKGVPVDIDKIDFKMTTKNGLAIPREAYIVETVGDEINPEHLVGEGNKLKFRFKGNPDYHGISFVNGTLRDYKITRGDRPIEIVSIDGASSAPLDSNLIFSIADSLADDDGSDSKKVITWKVLPKDNPSFSWWQTLSNDDMTLEVSKLVGMGEFTVDVTVAQSDYYNESVAKTFVGKVTAGDVRNLSPKADTWLNDVEYNGEEQIQKPTIMALDPLGGADRVAFEGVDYTLSWLNNVNAGKAYMVITGLNTYEGTKLVPFQIRPKSIVYDAANLANVNFPNLIKEADGTYTLNDMHYTGTAQKGDVGDGSFLKKDGIGSVTLVDGVDYNIAYDNVINAGPVSLKIIGVGNYTGTIEAKYNIIPMDLSLIEEADITIGHPKDVIYNMKEQKLVDNEARIQIVVNKDNPDNIIKYDMILGTDYEYGTFSNNINVGEATAGINGKGNFTNALKKDLTFNITKKDLFVVPDEKVKISGKPDEALTFTFKGLIDTDTVTVKAGTFLERAPGEKEGEYPILLGTLALDETVGSGKNYELKLDPVRKNYTITAYNTDKVATVSETYKNATTGWSQGNEVITAPAGYKISLLNTPSGVDVDGKPKPIVWKDSLSVTDFGYYPGDGDFETNPMGYYLINTDDTSPDFGNVTIQKFLSYKQDGAAPLGQINMNNEKIFTDFNSVKAFDTYFNRKINFDIMGEDVTSGLKSTRYYLADKDMSKSELSALADDVWVTLKKDATRDIFQEVLSTDMKKIMYYEMKDYAGFTTYINTRGFYIDTVKPVVEILYDREGKWTADKSITVDLVVRENGSGLKNRYLDYRSVDLDDPTKEGNPTILDVDADGKTSIPLGEIPDGKLKFLVSASDNAGNSVSEYIEVFKDTVKPNLQLLGDTATFHTYKDIDVSASVGDSGITQMLMQRRDYSAPVDETMWKDVTADYNDDKVIRVTDNGTYYFKYINGADVWSNVANITFTTLDTLKPILNVSASSNNVPILSDVWSGDSVKIVFNNEAKNLGGTTYFFRTKSASETDYGAWTKAIKNAAGKGEIEIGDSGRVEVQLKATAANGMEDTKSFVTKVDKRAPYAEISKDTNKWYELLGNLSFNIFYKKSENIVISGNDAMSGLEKIEYCLVKDSTAEEVQDKASIEGFVSENGGWTKGTLVGDKIEVAIVPNNKYVVYGKVSDQVGNVQYVSSDGIIVDDEAPILEIDKSGFSDYGVEGKWIIDPNHKPMIEVSDTLSGPDYVVVSIEGKVVQEDIRSGNALLELPKDGKYSVDVAAYDRSGNTISETFNVQRDTTPAEIVLDGDNINVGIKKHVGITPKFGVSGLKSVEMKFVPEGTNADRISWIDVKDSYASGYDVLENGTFYARMSNKLGAKDEQKLVFENIRFIDPVVKVDLVNDEGNIVGSIGTGWMEAVRVRFYNDPREVADFEYYYQIDKGAWTQVPVDTITEGYAYITTVNGSHEYSVKTKNVSEGHVSESSVKSITVNVDADKPVGTLTLDDQDSTLTPDKQWNNTAHDDAYKINQGYVDGVTLNLKDVSDSADGSGLKSIETAVLKSFTKEALDKYPKNDAEMRTMLTTDWKAISSEQLAKVVSGNPIEILVGEADYEYMVFVKIKDEAGNVTYITSGGLTVRGASSKPVISTTYSGEWLVKDGTIPVTIEDSLSKRFSGEIATSIGGGTPTSKPFTLVDENVLLLNTADYVDGEHNIAFNAKNNAGVSADKFSFDLKIDRVKPKISISRQPEFDTEKFIFLHLVPIVGVSKIGKVEVKLPDGKTEDLTANFAQGYKVKQNGLYQFSVTNGAGVKSDIATYTATDLKGNPIVKVDGFLKDSGDVYHSGDWADEEVRLRITPKEILVGVTNYYYRIKGSEDWQPIFESEGEYWLNIKDNGEYVYEFMIQAENGLESEILVYNVNIFKDDLTFDYELSTTEMTRGGVELTIIPTNTGDEVLYSFDNGTTFGTINKETFYSNQYVDVIIKGKAGNRGKRQVQISKIDNLAPLMGLQGSEVKEEVKVNILMAVTDSPQTLDFDSSGISSVFLTRNNPMKNGDIRSVMESGDEAFSTDIKGNYTIDTEVYTNKDGNKGDNVWIVAADKVGNASVKSLRVEPNKKVIEEPEQPLDPDDPYDPGNTGGNNGNTVTNEPGKIIKEITYNRKIAYAEQTIDNTSIKKIDRALKEFRELQKKKNELNKKQVNKINSRVDELNQKKAWWILVYFACGLFAVSGLSYAYFAYRSKKRKEEENESLDY